MKKQATILDVMSRVLGDHFRGASWDAWRSALAAMFGLPMTDDQVAQYRQCTGRTRAPQGSAREAWFIVGRRGGKSRIAALIAVHLACFVAHPLAPGESGVVMVIASDRRQARIILRYVIALLRSVPALERQVASILKESVELTSGIVIEVHTASFRSTRGYTAVAVIADEIAFWGTDDAAQSDTEILAALRPAMATVPSAMLIAISTPYARRGELWHAFEQHYGHDDDPLLVWQADSRTMNPMLPEHVVKQAYEEDEARASAEFGALFRRDIESLFAIEALKACTIPNRLELPAASGLWYSAFVDPSGGSADSMTLGIAHDERDHRVLDLVREVVPPFSPEQVVAEFAGVLKSYHISEVTGDKYAGEWPREQFRKVGITYRVSERTRSEIYLEALPRITSTRVELLDHDRLLRQLQRLERHTGRSGRDAVDHPPGGHDDVANAACGALILARAGVSDEALAQALAASEDGDRARDELDAHFRELEFNAVRGSGSPWSY